MNKIIPLAGHTELKSYMYLHMMLPLVFTLSKEMCSYLPLKVLDSYDITLPKIATISTGLLGNTLALLIATGLAKPIETLLNRLITHPADRRQNEQNATITIEKIDLSHKALAKIRAHAPLLLTTCYLASQAGFIVAHLTDTTYPDKDFIDASKRSEIAQLLGAFNVVDRIGSVGFQLIASVIAKS